MAHRRMGVEMAADSLDTRITQALHGVAREQGLRLWRHRLYGNGDTIVAFTPTAKPGRVVALLPIDHTLRLRMAESSHTKAGLCRILRADAFSDESGWDEAGQREPGWEQDDRDAAEWDVTQWDITQRDNARDLCRLGLVGCHALTETLPHAMIHQGLRVRVLFDGPGVEIMTEGPSTVSIALDPDLVRLLWQFRPADRFARAFGIFRRQLTAAHPQRASG